MYFLILLKVVLLPFIKSVSKLDKNHTINLTLYNILFESIQADVYDLSSIYFYNYTTIKIKKHNNINNNSLIAVFGILVNDYGLKIEKEMLEWLEPEYEIYKIYQKYPGILYEYPALRFAQWIINNKNLSFLLYLHTKGATHRQFNGGEEKIRRFWKKEFTKPRNKIYITEIMNNLTDIATPLSYGKNTWYNGMYISKTAFLLNKIIPFKNRFIYEYLFNNKNTRIKGIISNNTNKPWVYLDYFHEKIKNGNIHFNKSVKYKKINRFQFINFHPLFNLIFVYLLKIFLRIYNKKFK